MSELKRILLEHNIPEDKAELFEQYAEMIVETNKSFNLTRILSEEDMAIKHFIDSIAAADYIPGLCKVLVFERLYFSGRKSGFFIFSISCKIKLFRRLKIVQYSHNGFLTDSASAGKPYPIFKNRHLLFSSPT